MILPATTRLVHIGPHKTGTTSLQAALWSARPELIRQGVRHVGRSQNPSVAVRAVVRQPSPYSVDRPPSMSNWNALVREIDAAKEPRIVVSSEFFAWADSEAIGRIVSDLDPERVHVAVTLRPLARVIPSMWQQNVQLGTVTPLEAWVHEILDDRTKPFWQLQRHDELIRRWLEVVGPERLTAVVVDDRDHDVV
ncbi:MAG TPA: hypothetical protein VFM38_14960, partial [Candidatus Limnocylindrales bacterium]|nr:hypothetical protein [Candidatus Limnocylindrales bacterium]